MRNGDADGATGDGAGELRSQGTGLTRPSIWKNGVMLCCLCLSTSLVLLRHLRCFPKRMRAAASAHR